MDTGGETSTFSILYDWTPPPLDGICTGPYCTESECESDALSATTTATWLTLSRSGATVTYTAGENQSTSDRLATVQLGAGGTFSLTQRGADCDTSPGVDSSSLQFSSAGGSQPVTVQQPNLCSSPVSVSAGDDDWLSAGPNPVVGNGPVTVNVTGNTTTSTLSGTVMIGGTSVPVTVLPCTYTVSPTSVQAAADGGPYSVNVAASGSSCPWTASSNTSWIHSVQPSSDTGDDSVGFIVDPNTTTSTRTGTLTVAGVTVTVTQPGQPVQCTFTVNPTSMQVSEHPGNYSVSVTGSDSSCSWTAGSNNPDWIHSVLPSSGTGTGPVSVSFDVDGNTSTSSRTGTLTVAGQTVTVTQVGCPTSPGVVPSSRTFGPGPGSASVALQTSPTCPSYSVSVSAGDEVWLSAGPNPVAGDGTLTVGVTGNPTTSTRSGTVMIGGTSVSVTQTPCTYTVNPTSRQVSRNGGNYSVTVTASSSSCSWTASSNNLSWIYSVSPSSGTGTGPVSVGFTVDPNPGTSRRTGTLTVAGQTVTIRQSGQPCPSSPNVVDPSSGSLPFGSGSNESWVVLLGESGSCTYPVSADQLWITVSSTSVSGNGTVMVSVEENPGTTARSGTVTIGSRSLSVTQGSCAPAALVAPTSLTLHGVAGSGTVTLQESSVCSYTVSAGETWLTVDVATVAGNGTVTVSATAHSGSSSRSGTVTIGGLVAVPVTQLAPADAGLSDLSLSSGTLTPSFSSSTTSYAATVGWSVTTVTVTATASDANASLTVSGTAVSSGTGYAVSLPVGTTAVDVSVTACPAGASSCPSGEATTLTYVLSLAREVWTDAVLTVGVTPIKAIHMEELRTRTGTVSTVCGLTAPTWTDAVLTVGVTPIKAVHVEELRTALSSASTACGLTAPTWTDAVLTVGVTPIKAAHFMELRSAVEALEGLGP